MPTSIHSQVVIPFGQIDVAREERGALTLEDAGEVFAGIANWFGGNPDPVETAYQISQTLRRRCDLHRSHEHLFLLLYFDNVIEKLNSGITLRGVLLPLPKARFSLAGEPTSITTDFAFWTGRRFVTVFIGESHFDQKWSADERILKLWGFEVFRLMADQLETRGLAGDTGMKIVEALRLVR